MAEAKNNAKTNVTNELVVPTFSLSPSEVIMRVTEGLINLPQVFEVHGDGGDDDVLSFSLYTLPNVDPEILKSLPHYSSPSALDAKKTKMVTIDAETVSSAWLSSIGRSLLMYLTGQVLPKIPRLTKGGTAQLAVDLGYLLNVARSLNLEHEELERWKEVVDMDEESGRVGGENDYVFEQVARMRGWR